MGKMLEPWLEGILPEIEIELQRALQVIDRINAPELYRMLVYHMGWEEDGSQVKPGGKRIRPVLLILSNASIAGEWKKCLPAAAAVELIHNFSLIHDDIEDNSQTRHGRLALWSKWGVAQAINTGDALFTIAFLELMRLEDNYHAQVVVRSVDTLHHTCLKLTQGQHLDIAYEKEFGLKSEDYWPVVEGKTAALLEACCEMGAFLAGGAKDKVNAYRSFGKHLGLAFQALDDLLGIWGDPIITGKSVAIDLKEGKKTLPVLYGLEKQGKFARQWKAMAARETVISEEEVAYLAELLNEEGAKQYTQQIAEQLTSKALDALDSAAPEGDAGLALRDLALRLLQREK